MNHSLSVFLATPDFIIRQGLTLLAVIQTSSQDAVDGLLQSEHHEDEPDDGVRVAWDGVCGGEDHHKANDGKKNSCNL